MTKYDLNGVHVLNKFIWANLVLEGLMSTSDYTGLVPIIPTQQVPVFNDMAAGKPFIVYTYIVASYDVDLWANVEQVTYRIFSDDERKLRQITNFIIDLCKRYDWTASEINTWLDGNTNMPVDADDRRFDFKYVQVTGSTSAEPSAQEGGRQDSSVTVRMAFTHEMNGTIGSGRLGMRS